MTKRTKLELTRIGKDTEYNLEPRILIERPDLSNNPDGSSDNLLIHGDNLLALKALEQDYAGKVKCIYIDPPYNTGNAFEHYDDGLEHSQWLSLINPRLKLLRSLLHEEWVIYVHIDDYEQAYLRVIMDEVFWRDNFIACLPVVMNLKGNQDQFWFAGTHEYILVFARNKSKLKLWQFAIWDDELDWRLEDDIGLYKKWATLKRTGEDAPREKRPKWFYPIYISESNEVSIFRNNDHDIELFPITDWKEMSWRWSKEKVNADVYDIIVTRSWNNVSLYKKQRPEIWELPSKKPKSLFYKPEYSSWNWKSQLKSLWLTGFSYPKPENLIHDIIHISTNPWDLVLDSFLWSGTTAAVAHKMGRRWIGIELWDHAYTHAKVRMDKVIEGEQGGISKAVEWKGWWSYKFYELGPSLLIQDQFWQRIINKELDWDKLIQALCKIENYQYTYDDHGIKHGRSSESSFLHVTTRHINQAIIDDITKSHLWSNEWLLILARTFDDGINLPSNIRLKKIPKSILTKCEYGRSDYNLPVTESDYNDEEYDDAE